MTISNRRIVLASRPAGVARADDFRLESAPVPELKAGEVLVRNRYLSLDPYMRGRMNAQQGYTSPQALNEVMLGGTVGEVVATRHAAYQEGDSVTTMGGWQDYVIVRPDAPPNAGYTWEIGPRLIEKLDTSRVPAPAYLGPAGMPGVTAWYSLTSICVPQAGETVVVSAAAGAVGAIFGQLAKARGCRVIGIAGGAEKCRYLTEELGFDASVDYKSAHDTSALADRIGEVAPAGVDAYHDNVGGTVLNAILSKMNPFGRIAICGVISRYASGQPILTDLSVVLRSRLTLKGFVIMEQPNAWQEARPILVQAIAAGRIRYREDVVDGLEKAPEAFIGLLAGQNFGKQLIRLC